MQPLSSHERKNRSANALAPAARKFSMSRWVAPLVAGLISIAIPACAPPGPDDYRAKIQDCTRSLQAHPDRSDLPDLYRTRGHSYFFLDSMQRFEQDYARLIELEPKNVENYRIRGLVRTLYDAAGAIADFDTCIGFRPDNAEYRMFRAFVYFYLDSMENALKDYEKAIALSPKDGMHRQFPEFVHVLRGMSHLRNSAGGAAEDAFSRAIELSPKNGTLYLMRSFARLMNIQHARDDSIYMAARADRDTAVHLGIGASYALRYEVSPDTLIFESDTTIINPIPAPYLLQYEVSPDTLIHKLDTMIINPAQMWVYVGLSFATLPHSTWISRFMLYADPAIWLYSDRGFGSSTKDDLIRVVNALESERVRKQAKVPGPK